MVCPEADSLVEARGQTTFFAVVSHTASKPKQPVGLYRVRARNYDFFLKYKIKIIYLREQKDRFYRRK